MAHPMRDDPTAWHDYGGAKLMPMAFAGHAFYCRKCVVGEATDGKFHIRNLDGIVLPETVGDASQFVEILAVGPKVGKPCSEKHARHLRAGWVRKYGVKQARRSNLARSQELIGMLAYIPVNDDPCILRSFISPDEFFIEESLPAYLMPKEHQDEKVAA